MADLPQKPFLPLSGRRGISYNQQPLREGTSGSIPPPQQGFLDDPTTIALYQFEGSFITVDTIQGNNLSNINNVVFNSADFKENTTSAEFSGSNHLEIADGSQSNDYPLKNGQTNLIYSTTFWIKISDVTGPKVFFAKSNSVNKSVEFGILANGNLGYRVHTGIVFEDNDFGLTLSPNVWYHIGLEVDHNTNTYRLTLFNDSTSVENIVTVVGAVSVPTSATEWSIGADGDGANAITGLIDEYSLTGRILGIPDIREIRQGVYDGPLSVRATQFGIQTLYITPETDIRVSNFGIQVLVQEPSGPVRVSQYGIQVLAKPIPMAVREFPNPPTERLLQTQAGKRVFPV